MKASFCKIEIIFIVLLLTICFSSVSYSQNIFYNGDFEVVNPENTNFPDNWWIEYCNTQDVTTIEIDDQVKHSGNYSLKFTTIAGKTSEDCVVMPSQGPDTLYAGGLYKISYWVKTEGAGVHSVAINVIWGMDQIAEPLTGTNDWTYREAVLTYYPGWFDEWDEKDTHFMSLWFNSDSCAEAGSAWYDDIVVEFIGVPPTPPEDLSLIADYKDNQVVLNWGAATENTNPIDYYLIKKVKEGAVTPNICANPSFEDPNDSFTFPDTWNDFFWASADQEWAENVAHTGDFSVTISSDVGGHGFISKGLFPPEGTRGYDAYISAYIKTENVENGSGAFIDFFDWYGNKQGLFGTNDWTFSDAVKVNVYPGTYCALQFGNYFEETEVSPSGQAWFDDVAVVLFDSIGQASGLTFTDTDVEENETYYYSVRAIDTEGLVGDAQLLKMNTIKTTDLVYNGDFEVVNPENTNFPDNWWIEYCNTQDVTTIEIDDQVKHSGNYSLKFTTIAGKTSEDCVVMPVQGPDTLYWNGLYKISYWAKTEGEGVHSVAVNVLWGMDQIAEPLSGTTDWTYKESVIAFRDEWFAGWDEKDTHFMSLWFNSDSCGEAGSAWYDDIKVEYLGNPPSIPENIYGTFAGGQALLEWGAATEETNPIKYYLVKKVMKGADSPNICENPSFEEPNDSFTFPATWNDFYWASAAQEWAEGVARTGDFSVTISAAEAGHGFISKGLYPSEGTRGFDAYISAYIKTENVENGSGAFVNFFDWYGDKQGLFGTNDWTVSDAVKADIFPGTYCALQFGNYFEPTEISPKGQAWFDDVSVVLFDSIGQTAGRTFVDTDVIADTTYYYTVRAVDNRGLLGPAQLVEVKTAGGMDVEERDHTLPRKTELVGNYPNPFNPSTTILFNLQKAGEVRISVYNILGQKIAQVADKHFQAGEHKIHWNVDENVSSGIYFYELRAGDYKSIKKMTLMR